MDKEKIKVHINDFIDNKIELTEEEFSQFANQLYKINKSSAICFFKQDLDANSVFFNQNIDAFKFFYNGNEKSKSFLWNALKEENISPILLKDLISRAELSFYECWWNYEQKAISENIIVPEWKNINIIETEELLLKEANSTDENLLKQDFIDNPNDYFQYTLEELKTPSFELDYHCNLRNSYIFSIRDKNTQDFIGVIKLFCPDKLPLEVPNDSVELAYYILSHNRKKGFAKKAIKALVESQKNNELKQLKSTTRNYIYTEEYLGKSTVFIRPLKDNMASNVLAKSLGFSFISEIKEKDLCLNLYTY